jgi:hypothetical protein
MKERHECKAEVHDSHCDGWASNRDHFTPVCLIKKLKLNKELLSSEENLTWVNKKCHALKDAVTPQILQKAKRGRGVWGYDEFMQIWRLELKKCLKN